MVVTDEGPLQKEGGIFQSFTLHITVESYRELCDLYARLNASPAAIHGEPRQGVTAADHYSSYPLFIEIQDRLSKVTKP